jgi:hypothetical protein
LKDKNEALKERENSNRKRRKYSEGKRGKCGKREESMDDKEIKERVLNKRQRRRKVKSTD